MVDTGEQIDHHGFVGKVTPIGGNGGGLVVVMVVVVLVVELQVVLVMLTLFVVEIRTRRNVFSSRTTRVSSTILKDHSDNILVSVSFGKKCLK